MQEDEGRSLQIRCFSEEQKVLCQVGKAIHAVTQPWRSFWPGPWEGPINESGSCSWSRLKRGTALPWDRRAIPLAGRGGRGRSRGAQPGPGGGLVSLFMGVSVCPGRLRNSRWFRQVPIRPTVWFPAGMSGHQSGLPGPSVMGRVWAW